MSGFELIWPGKYTADGRRRRPSCAPARLRHLEEVAGEGAPGRLLRGDNLAVMERLLEDEAGSLDLIVIDPPFGTGLDFHYRAAGQRVRAYSDREKVGPGAYLSGMHARLERMRALLNDRGSIYVHVDHRAAPAMRFVLDEVFGADSFVNEIVWFYKTGGMPERLGFGRKHDTILFYVKDRAKAHWFPQKERSYLMHRYGFSNVAIHEDGRGRYTLVNCRDVFDIPALRGNQPERVDYPTQKPEALLARMILASSPPGGLVADFYCGSGTALVAAARAGRRWLGCDAEAWAINTARKRLARLPQPPAFAIFQGGAASEDLDFEARARRVKGGVEVELTALSAGEEGAESPDWVERLDAWAVETEAPRGAFKPGWSVDRQRGEAPLPVRSPALQAPRRRRLRVRVIDARGRRGVKSIAIA